MKKFLFILFLLFTFITLSFSSDYNVTYTESRDSSLTINFSISNYNIQEKNIQWQKFLSCWKL